MACLLPAVLLLSPVPGSTQVPGDIRWADGVIGFSSQYTTTFWSAEQALGPPDTHPSCGDITTSWASLGQDDRREYLELSFSNPAPINQVLIYETYNAGAVDLIQVRNPSTLQWQTVWSQPAEDLGGTCRILTAAFALTDFAVDAVRIELNSPAVPSWNEIDAVGVSGTGDGSVPVTHVPAGSLWRYLDNGSDQGTAWREPDFDDSGWTSGRAQLGYGDFDETTTLGFGGDPNNKHITCYFRHEFTARDVSFLTNLTMNVLRDDGAVVYLNGIEVWRSLVPAGAIHYRTLATTAVSGAAENLFNPVILEPSALLEGRNVLAVEIHQNAADSSDLSFDLELAGVVRPGPPRITRQPQDAMVVDGATARFDVVASGAMPLGYHWEFNGLLLEDAHQAELTLPFVTTNHAGTYRVIVTNHLGATASAKATLTVRPLGDTEFQIVALLDTGVMTVDHNNLTGDDRGGIGASATRVFYTGDNATAGFLLEDLGGGMAYPGPGDDTLDAMIGDLRSQTLYLLADGLGSIDTRGGTVTRLLALDDDSLQPTGDVVALSTPITLTGGNSGLFAGYGRVVIVDNNRVYDILLPSGEVADLGAIAPFPHRTCENWAYWGVAEFFEGALHLVYAGLANDILRTRVPEGPTTTLAAFQDLNDLCCLTLALDLDRWYFHFEGVSSQFGGGNENLGFADALFSYARPPAPPEIRRQPRDTIALAGGGATFSVLAGGSRPIHYQWQANGQPIPGATSNVLNLASVSLADAGSYRVLVTNAYGMAWSEEAGLSVVELGGENFRITRLGTDNATLLEHGSLTGDDRSGIAASDTHLFYTGDSGTGGFLLSDLGGGFNTGIQYDALIGDLRSERVYTLANGGVPLTGTGGQVTALLELDGQTLQPTGRRVDLSTPFTMGNGSGLFAGFGRLVVHTGTDVYHIDPADGTTLHLGTMAPVVHLGCEAWAHWGVAEFVDGVVWLVHVQNTTSIVRTRIPDGQTELVQAFDSLADMCAITVSVRDDRWYFHHEGVSQFGGLDESIGFVEAAFDVVIPPGPPVIGLQPVDVSRPAGWTAEFRVRARGSAPLHYQWFLNGAPLPGARQADLVLTDLHQDQAGAYTVVVSNLLGSVTSEPALLTVSTGAFVALYADRRFVDHTTNSASSEAGNLQASMERLGFTVFPFEDILLAVSAARIIVMPELEVGDLNAFLSVAERAALNDFVRAGGLLVVTGTDFIFDRTLSLLNDTYDLALQGGDPDYAAIYTRTFETAGSTFFTGPMTLTVNFGAMSLDTASLPFSARSLYQSGNHTLLSLIPLDAGRIVYLGWDWFDASPIGFQDQGWLDLLNRALRQTNPLSPAPARIVSDPVSQGVFAGATATFRVRAIGQAPVSIQWRFNDAPIPDATNAVLVVTHVGPAQVGSYFVTVTNALGGDVSEPADLSILTAPPRFRVATLTGNNAFVIGHNEVTGDDRGGIAASTDHVFYSGDSGTGRFDAGDLGGGTTLPTLYGSLFTDLETETVYVFADADGQPVSGGFTPITSLIQVDDATGALTQNRVFLDIPILLNANAGIFSGFGWVLLLNTASRDVLAVEIQSGRVLVVGTLPNSLTAQSCETWAFWGVAEFFDGAFHLLYASFTSDILRTRVPDGVTTVAGDFTNLGDMCSITVVPSRQRWYFHHEFNSQFGNLGENLGYADATFEYALAPRFSVLGIRFGFEDSPFGPFSFTVVDDRTAGSDLIFSITSTNEVVAPPENILIEGSGTNFTITVIPAPNAFGNTILTITATDEDGASSSADLGISFRSINDPPRFTLAGAELSALDLDGPRTVPGWAADISPGPANESGQSLSFQLATDHDALFAQLPTLDNDGVLTFTPAPGAAGTATVTVSLTDNGGILFGGRNTSDPQSFIIVVLRSNMPPTADSLAVATPEDIPLAGMVTGADPDGDAVTFQLVNAPGIGAIQFQPSGAFLYTPPPHFSGQTHFTFNASDGQSDSLPASVTISILPVNDPPVALAEAGPVADLVDQPAWPLILAPDNHGALVTLRDAGSSDVEGQALTYSWLEAGMALPIAQGEVVTHFFGPGLHEVVLLVDDGQDTGQTTVRFEVISPASGLELLIMEVDNSILPRERKHPLIVMLKVAAASFDRDSWTSGRNQVEAFLNKLQAQVTRLDPVLAERWRRKAGVVLEAIRSNRSD